MVDLALRFFGLPQVSMDGAPIDIRRRKEIALLAYLAVTQRAHSRDSLAALLWPDYDQSSARGNLRRNLSGIKHALGAGWLAVDREQAALPHQDGLWVDAVAFHAHLAQCETHGHSKEQSCPDCLAPLQTAVALYGDDFLAGFSLLDAPEFDMWQVHQAESLRRQLCQALQRLANCCAGIDDYAAAVVHARRWLNLDALHEPALRTLMRLHAQCGERSAALRQYDNCRQTLADELGVQPEPETVALCERIQSGATIAETERDVFVSSTAPSHNLPEQLTPFIGRTKELDQIERRLADPHCRLLTIVGPGGIGKTRLAIQVAQQRLDAYSDGVCFVDLTAVDSADLLATTVLHTVAPDEYGDMNARRRLCERLCNRQTLLLLDNFEHLLQGTDLLPELLRSAPELTILVTSRERLNLLEEWLAPLDGLVYPVPDADPTDLQDCDATRLFRDCVRRVRPGWQPSQTDTATIAGICRALEGMPLGIELAAPWTRSLPLAQVGVELERGLSILRTSLRDIPERHRSMNAVFDQSWQMLGPNERSVMRQMSVFRGGCTLAAAQAVTGARPAELATLVDGSWLRLRANGRYDMHELVRQYCEEKLSSEHESSTGEALYEVHKRHCDFFAMAVQDTPQQLDQQILILRTAPPEYANLQRALYWAVRNLYLTNLTPLLSGMWHAAEASGFHDMLDTTLTSAINILEAHQQSIGGEAPVDDTLNESLVRLYRALASISAYLHRIEKAEEQIAHLSARIDKMATGEIKFFWQSNVYRVRCQMALHTGDYNEALNTSLKALTYYESDNFVSRRNMHRHQEKEVGQIYHQADILASVADANWHLGNYDHAERDWRRSIEMSDKIGERRLRAQHCGQLARLMITTGRYPAASVLAKEAIRSGASIGDNEWVTIATIWLGCERAAQKDYETARQYLQQGVDGWRRSLYHRMLVAFIEMGRVELAEGHITAAHSWFADAERNTIQYDSPQSIYLPAIYLGMGWTELADTHLSESTRLFRRVLSTENCTAWERMEAIAGLAEVAALEGRREEAVELLSLVVAHPFTAYAQREQSQQSLAALKHEMASALFAKRVDAGVRRDLDATITELLDPSLASHAARAAAT